MAIKMPFKQNISKLNMINPMLSYKRPSLLFFVEHDRASTRLNNNDGEILVVEPTVDVFYFLPRIDVHAFDNGCKNEIEW